MGCILNHNGNEFTEAELINLESTASVEEVASTGQKIEGAAVVIHDTEYEYRGNKYKRVSNVINNFKGYSSEKAWYEFEADKVWGRTPHEEAKMIATEQREMSYDEYVTLLEEKDRKAKYKGKVIHAMVEQMFMGDRSEKIQQYITLGGFHGYEFNWVSDNIEGILRMTGTNIIDALDNEEYRDEVLSEVIVLNEDLGLGGAIDIRIKHHDGSYSLIDVKTGKNFNRLTSRLLKYYNGPTRSITASQRDVAKLQLALYAFLMKANDPDAKFREMRILHLPNHRAINGKIDPLGSVDMENYLPIIKQWLESDPEFVEVRGTLMGKDYYSKLFNPREYNVGTTSDLPAGHTVAMQAKLLKEQMTLLQAQIQAEGDEMDKGDLAKLKSTLRSTTKQYIDLTGDPTVNYEAWSNDISVSSEWVGNIYDTGHPYIQLYTKEFEDGKQRAQRRVDVAYKGFLRRMRPVYSDYQKRKKIPTPWEKIPALKGQLNFNNYQDLFEPMFKKIEDSDGATRYEWRVTDEDWAQAMTLHSLTSQEVEHYKNLTDFVMEQFSQFFLNSKSEYGKALWNKEAYNAQVAGDTRMVTMGELFQGITNDGKPFGRKPSTVPFKYNKATFIPTVFMTSEEVRQRHGMLSKEHQDHLKRKYLSMFYEEQFEQWYTDEMALPFKYMPNENLMAEGNFTMNVEQMFDKFMRAMILKEELDDVYALGKGIQDILLHKKGTNGKAMERAAEFLDKQLELQVRGRGQRHIQLFGRDGDKDWIKMAKTFKQVVSAPIMWLKPISGTANATFTWLYTHKEGIKGSIMEQMPSIDPAAIDFTEMDLVKAHKEFMKMQYDAMMGNLSRNKAFLLLKKFQYLPDAYKFADSDNSLLTTRNKAVSQGTMYMFHAVPEEWISSLIMVAQMKNMKSLDGTSVWDLYEVKEIDDGIHDVVWKTYPEGHPNAGRPIVRGAINISNDPNNPEYQDVTELTSQEITRLKYVYQRMHGGYREDERTMMEYYIFGELFLQYKKYLPTILKNVLMSKQTLPTLGEFKPTGEFENDKQIMEWYSPIVEGRWRVLTKVIWNWIGLRQKYDNPKNALQRAYNIFALDNREDYKWQNMSPRQQEAMIDAYVSISTFMMLFYGRLAIFGAAGEDDSWYKIYMRIASDYSQQYNPWELSKNLFYNLTPVSFRKAHKAFMGLTELSWSAVMFQATGNENYLTDEGSYKGWAELRRSIPFVSSYRDIVHFLENQEEVDLEDYIFYRSIQN